MQKFLVFCSGSNALILKRCPSDLQKYMGIGATVLFTGILAFVSSAYAIYTIFNSYAAAIVFGLIWGLMIFNLDRYIVSSMKMSRSLFKNLLSATPRLVLAVLLALVIAKPLELKIFETEIQSELVKMEQEKYLEQEEILRKRFLPDMDRYHTEINAAKLDIAEHKETYESLALLALAEADGTGGSQRRNMGPIYKAKKKEADEAHSAYLDIKNRNEQLIDQLTTQKQTSTEGMQLALTELKQQPLNGFAARLEALHRLSSTSEPIWLANLFIMLLFIAIETAPILVKLMAYRSPYDFVLDNLEHQYVVSHDQKTTERGLAWNTQKSYIQQVGDFRTTSAVDAEKELIVAYFKKEVEKAQTSAVELD